MNPMTAFRGTEVTELKFGTSGLRGLVSDITDLEAFVNTRGFAEFLLAIGDARPGDTIHLACDLRPSSDGDERSILRAVHRAVVDAGFRAVHLGRLPTPALMHYAMSRNGPSVMVTGSHIPFDRNGIKFNKSTGEVLKSDEPAILRAVHAAREREYAVPASDSLFADNGMFKPEVEVVSPPVAVDAGREYLERYLSFLPDGILNGLRLAVYQHSAVGRDLLVRLLQSLGAEVVPFGRSEVFIPIDTEDISDETLDLIRREVAELSRDGGAFDAVVSTDGDSDRPLVIAVQPDGDLRFINGDLLGALVASFLQPDQVVVPISANDAVDRYFAGKDVAITKTRIGSPFVIDGMNAALAAGRKRVVGWEANGGFLTGSDIEIDGHMLPALPTRDAFLPIVVTLAKARLAGKAVHELLKELPARFNRAGLIDAFPREAALAIVDRLTPGDGGDGGDTAAAFELVQRGFPREEGFGIPVSINTIDGARITFDNGEIAHLRPSGNAPQLRLYAVADTQERANEIVRLGIAEPDGVLRRLEAIVSQARPSEFKADVTANIQLTSRLLAAGETPEVLAIVSGSGAARDFWQRVLDHTKSAFRAREALSFHEDLPTNQAFGLLLLWRRMRAKVQPGEGALAAFVFGDGTRSTPFTETDNGQKPAMATFVRTARPDSRPLSMVELAIWYFIPVQQHLKRSGFDGLVVKWGDEVQIPRLDLSGANPLFKDADIVRFVSLQPITEDTAKNKDWVGVDPEGRITAFIPRRPLSEMGALADRGVFIRKDGVIHGGVNLGSIAVSRALLDALLEEFDKDVMDPSADRRRRPALDPEFFTALIIAAQPDADERAAQWERAIAESADLAKLRDNLPDVLDRLVRVLERFHTAHGRPVKLVAMDFNDQYWGDIGQHAKIFEFYTGLNAAGDLGDIARAMAGIADMPPDARGNRIVNSTVSDAIDVRDSVLIDVALTGSGVVESSVLIGTRAHRVELRRAFDVFSTVTELVSAPGAGTYKVVQTDPVRLGENERATTLFLPDSAPALFRVTESCDLKDKQTNYDVPVMNNPMSFAEAHRRMLAASVESVREHRSAAEESVLNALATRT